MTFQQLSTTITAANADLLSDMYENAGALSITWQDAKDTPIFQLEPGQTPHWDSMQIVGLFSMETDLDIIQTLIKTQLETDRALHFEIKIIEDQDWVTLTQANFQPHCFANKLWVVPAWEETANLTGKVIRLDPGLAFGTGTHPTTQLCLEWIATHPPEHQTVIDYGCGSGILSLAALAMDATAVWAVDHDPQALQATAQNNELNEFSGDRLKIVMPENLPEIKCSYLIANILANPLKTLLPTFVNLLENNGILILSGILKEEADEMIEHYSKTFSLVDHKDQEDWTRLVFCKSV